MKKSTVFLLILLAIFFTSTLFLLYMNFHKSSITSNPISSPNISPTEQGAPTSSLVKDENVYVNDRLGFSITLPDSWTDKYNINEEENFVQFLMRDSSTNKAYLFSISVMSDSDWDNAQSMPHGTLITRNAITKKVYVQNRALENPFTDTLKAEKFSLMSKDVNEIISTFKLTDSVTELLMPKQISDLFSSIKEKLSLDLKISNVENKYFYSQGRYLNKKVWQLEIPDSKTHIFNVISILTEDYQMLQNQEASGEATVGFTYVYNHSNLDCTLSRQDQSQVMTLSCDTQ